MGLEADWGLFTVGVCVAVGVEGSIIVFIFARAVPWAVLLLGSSLSTRRCRSYGAVRTTRRRPSS